MKFILNFVGSHFCIADLAVFVTLLSLFLYLWSEIDMLLATMENLLLSFEMLLNLKQQFIHKEISIKDTVIWENIKRFQELVHTSENWLSAPIFCIIYQTGLITGFPLSLPLPLGSGDETPVWGLNPRFVFFSPGSPGTLLNRRCLTDIGLHPPSVHGL